MIVDACANPPSLQHLVEGLEYIDRTLRMHTQVRQRGFCEHTHLDAQICKVNISLSPEMLNGIRLVFIMISTCLSESPSQGQARVMRHDETL